MPNTEQCIAAIRKAVGRDLSPADLEAVAETLEARARGKREAGKDPREAELEAAQELADDAREAAFVERRNTKLNYAVRHRFRRHVEGFGEGNAAAALEAYQVGVNKRRLGSRLSGDALQKAWDGKLLGGLLHDLNAAGKRNPEILASGALDREIAREMWEIGKPGGKPGVTGSPEARQIADTLHKWQEVARRAQNDRGAWVRNMPGYIVRQSHNEFAIRRMGFDEWRDFILPKLDAERTFQGANPAEVLRRAYDDIVTGGHLAHKSDAAEQSFEGFTGSANLASRASRARVLHFRGADDFMDYNDRLGRGSLFEGAAHGMQQAARNIALFETWGTNPRAMFEHERQKLVDAAHGDPRRANAARAAKHEHQFKELSGETRIPGNAVLARVGSIVRAVQSMSKLGGSTLSSISDIAMVANESRARGGQLLQGYRTSMQSVLRGRGEGEQRQILNAMGVALDGQIGTIAARFTSNDDLGGRMSKLMRLYFRYNLLSWWTDSQKAGVGLAVSEELATRSQTGWADLDAGYRETLETYGFIEQDWRLINRMRRQGRAADGRRYVDPSEVATALTDAEIRNSIVARGAAPLGKRGGVTKSAARIPDAAVRRAREDLETKLRAFIVDRTEFAVPTPGARERAFLNQGTQAGTPIGEAMRFIAQFKQFPVTVASRVLGEATYGRGDLVGLAHLVVSTTILGYLAMSAKQMARGREPRDPADAGTWTAALLQGGGSASSATSCSGNTTVSATRSGAARSDPRRPPWRTGSISSRGCATATTRRSRYSRRCRRTRRS